MSVEKICSEIFDELTSYNIDESLKKSFITVIEYLNQFPENLSVRSKKNPPDAKTKDGIIQLAVLYFNGFYSPTVPKLPQTVPDESETEKIKIAHLESMSAEKRLGVVLRQFCQSNRFYKI